MVRTGYDPASNILTITVKGFLAPADVPALAVAIGTAARQARAVDPDFDVLVDSLDFPVQANDVADMLAAIMRGGMVQTSGHAAVVVASHLNKLQVERTLAHPRLAAFLSIADARRWLADKPVDRTDIRAR